MMRESMKSLKLSKSREMATSIIMSGIQIEKIRKDIKNIHLSVHPPDGRVRVSVPLSTSDETLRIFLITKSDWIKKQRKRFSKQERQTKREYVSGESHYFFGRKYHLGVKEDRTNPMIEFAKNNRIESFVKPKSTITQRRLIFERFYRNELEKIIPKLREKWPEKVGVRVDQIRIKKMKTKWGTCNQTEKRIWLNLELAKHPIHCIDYVFVHELVHFKERTHNDRFVALLSEAYPRWKQRKEELNNAILGYCEWGCKSEPKLKQ